MKSLTAEAIARSIADDFFDEIQITSQVLLDATPGSTPVKKKSKYKNASGAPKKSKAQKQFEQLITKLKEELEEKKNDSCLLLPIDVDFYENFEQMAADMLEKLLEASRYKETKPGWEKVNADSDAYDWLERLLVVSFPKDDLFVLIVLQHYEKAAEKWDESDYGYLRALLSDAQTTSMVVTSTKEMCEVSKYPEGSSPLYNIFIDVMRME